MSEDMVNKLRSYMPNIKIGLIQYGSSYYIDLSNYFYLGLEKKNNNNNNCYSKQILDFIWISPYYEYCLKYVKIKYKMDKVSICPYIWDPRIIKYKKTESGYNFNVNNVNNIGIFEGNILPTKTMIIPTYICEVLENKNNLINNVFITNIKNFFNKHEFHTNMNKLSLIQNKKVKCELNAVNLLKYMKVNNINTIVSHQIYNGLNYLHLEALYLRVPLVHNSKYIKDYGYYYPDFDVEKGAEQLENIILNHANNLDNYNKSCEESLFNYSTFNKKNIYEYEKLLLDIFK